MESSPSAASADGGDVVLWGMTTAGRTFRPSDWAERLAGLTSAFGFDQKLEYSPLVRPVNVREMRAVVVESSLAELEPRLYQFMLQFARDNELQMTHAHEALASLQTLSPPVMPRSSGEPREPV